MRKAVIVPFLLMLWMLLWTAVSPGTAGSRTYYDANGNVISAETYQKMRQRRRECLEATSNHEEFTRCMEEVPTASWPQMDRGREPLSPGPAVSADDPVSDGGDGARAVPEAFEPPAPRKMENPVIPGQREQPVRVIERDIAVPGGGILKLKEYQYE